MDHSKNEWESVKNYKSLVEHSARDFFYEAYESFQPQVLACPKRLYPACNMVYSLLGWYFWQTLKNSSLRSVRTATSPIKKAGS
jgi:hypothetical protein